MRPRRPCKSDDAPTTATVFGQSSFPISGTARPHSTQAEAARDNAAQDLGRTALDRELGRDRQCEGNLLVQRHAVARVRLKKRAEIAHALGQLLLPDGAEILDD